MEEKRRETGSSSPAPTISGASSLKSTDSPATEPPPPRRRGQKRKSTTTTSHSSSAPPKRHAREKAAAAAAAASGGLFSLLPPIHNGPLTRARQLSDNNAAIFSALNASKNDHSSSVNDSVVNNEGREEKVTAAQEEFKKFMAEIDAEFDTIRCRDSNVHVVPIAAGWFSWTSVHSIEKQTLRSFFNGKVENRTPEIYQEIRNWIMKKFHANPSTDVELKDLAELSVGDLEARQEVMEFLDHWGLINYHPFLQNDPVNVDADPNTDAEKAEKTDSVIEKLFQFENEQSSPDLAPRANWSAAAVPSGLFPESIAEELVKQEGPAVEYHCNSCSADCSRKRYHCQKQADFDLCSECYNNGKFGSGMCPSDFILMEPAESSGGTGGKWTDQETLLLLEALELFKENWNEIAEHVATKTKAQCILHFLQMPIEDNFLDDDDGTRDGALESKEPTSINNESSVPKDNLEPSEGVATKDNSGPAENGSGKESAESGSGKGNSEGAVIKDGSGPAESGSGKVDSEGAIAKDHSGPAEGKIGIGNSEGAITKDNSGPAESGNGKGNFDILASNSSKEDSEPLERKTDINDAEPVLTQLETSKSEDAPDGKMVQGKEEDVVIKALKEAFHVAGCPLTPEDQLSFAEAGNSVMALAAFLTQLVEPGLATAYAHSSLKTISRSTPGSQLAIRHCFILEDPADDENKHVVSESMASEKIDQNAPELSKEEMTNEKKIISSENSTPILDGSHLTEGQSHKVENSAIRDDSQLPLGEHDTCAVNSGFLEKPGEEIPQAAEKPDEKSELTEKPDEEMPQVLEKVDEEKPSVSEKPDDEKLQVAVKLDDEKVAEKHDETNDTEQAGTKLVTETQNCGLQNEQSTSKDQVASESEVMPPPCSASGLENLKKNEADNVKSTNSIKDTVVEPSSVVSDKTQQQEIAGEVPMVEAAPETGEDKMDVDKSGDTKSTEKTAGDPKSKETTKLKEDDNVAKLKRAALATLSAATVKSKLLANQEEDEIRQLATILIEKQMRKLEVKLSYFTEMEGAITRVRDQLERSRQKLFNERAQIIASRLGIPPSSSRMLPSSFPVNRMPPGLLNSMLRPPMGMGAQRPPMSRPVVTSAPPTTGTSGPPEVTGGSPTQPSAVDQPASVGAD